LKNIDQILYVLENEDLLLKREPFTNSIIVDYTIEQYESIVTNAKPEGAYLLLNKLEKINSEYGKLIIDFYLSKLKEIYKIPDSVKFNIEEDSQPEFEKSNPEDIEENKFDTERLIETINFENLKNSLINGGAKFNWEKHFFDIKEDLDDLDIDIYPTIINFVNLSFYQMYYVPEKDSYYPVAGSEQVNIRKNEININVTGVNFVIKTYEMVKGIFEALAQKSWNDNLDEYSQKYVRKITGQFYLEHYQWMFSVILWERHIDYFKEIDNKDYITFLSDIFSMNYSELLKFLLEG